MEKLTKEDIQFIDNYLLKFQVLYKDIRVEMIDHVASAVEERMQTNNEVFYDAFKAFMVENKKDLLQSQNKFIKQVRRSLFSDFLKELYSKQSLLALLVISPISIGVYVYLLQPFLEVDFMFFMGFYFILFFLIIIFQRVYLAFKFKLKRGKDNTLSSISIIGAYSSLVYYGLALLQKIILKFNNDILSVLVFVFTIYITYNLTQLFYKYQLKYIKEYKLC